MTVALGLMSKAAPQMNLLSEGFPITLTSTFLIMISSLPFMMESFSRLIESGYADLGRMMGGLR
jgi:flagellar biosynthetic protein FliR